MDLTGQVVIVTGGSRGIGAAIAAALMKRGAKVIAGSLSEPKETIEGVQYEVLDVRDEKAFQKLVKKIMKEHGKIDLLVNNAGAAGSMKPLEDVTEEEYESQFQTNVLGVFHGIQAVLPHMKKQGSGTIVTIASRAGSRPHPRLSVYSASKAAAIALMQGLAKELEDEGSAIKVFTVSPGGVNTFMREELFGKEDSEKQQSPERVAELFVEALDGTLDVRPGSDVKISRGEVTEVTPMN
jgi:NAD(P)-dependent dehydrogenase (short-subunit alcohol dehydrogenase family)